MIFKERIFLAVMPYAWWKRYVVTLVVMLGIMVCSWLLTYQPLIAHIKARSSSLHDIAQNVTAPIKKTAAEIASTSSDDIQERITKLKASCFGYVTAPDLISSLVRIGAEHQVTLESYVISPASQKSWSAHSLLILNVRGDFFDIMAYQNHLTKAISNIALMRQDISMQEKTMRSTLHYSVVFPKKN